MDNNFNMQQNNMQQPMGQQTSQQMYNPMFQQAPQQPMYQQPMNQQAPQQPMYQQPMYQQPKKNKGLIIGIIAGIVVLLAIISIILFAIVLGGDKDKDEDSDKKSKSKANQIVGTWECDEGIVFEFEKNNEGSMSYEYYDYTIEFEWEMDGKTLILTYPDFDTEQEYTIINISADKMTLENEDGEETEFYKD